MMKTILAYIKSYQATILVTNRWNRSHLSWIFSKPLTFTLHIFVLTQMCPSPSPMLFRAYFGALKWLQTQINIGKGKITQVFQEVVTRIVERSVKRWSLQRNKSQCSSLNTFGMGQNNNNVEHHTQSVTMDREKDVDAMYRKIQHRAPSCYSLKKQLTFQDTTTGSPEKWHLRNEYRNSILMMYQYLALGIDASSVSNFCAHFPDVILRRNQWWHREMSAVQFDLLPFLPAQQPLWQVQSFAPRGEELVILHNSMAGKRGQQMSQTWQGHYFHVLF